MTASFTIHIEMAETDVVWWAETADVAGLSVAAPTLMGLRRLISESVALHLGPEVDIALILSPDEADTGTSVQETAEGATAPARPSTRGATVRSAFVHQQVAA